MVIATGSSIAAAQQSDNANTGTIVILATRHASDVTKDEFTVSHDGPLSADGLETAEWGFTLTGPNGDQTVNTPADTGRVKVNVPAGDYTLEDPGIDSTDFSIAAGETVYILFVRDYVYAEPPPTNLPNTGVGITVGEPAHGNLFVLLSLLGFASVSGLVLRRLA
ncbi:MAG TPA: hypothetical protein VFL82_04355 [Thermomicrobiales bacterium]|nr:hypothetical protein [Thermomicrobiales bacterium]